MQYYRHDVQHISQLLVVVFDAAVGTVPVAIFPLY